MKTTNLCLTSEYLVYRDTWVMQYNDKTNE